MLRQKWSQPALLTRHSLMSAGAKRGGARRMGSGRKAGTTAQHPPFPDLPASHCPGLSSGPPTEPGDAGPAPSAGVRRMGYVTPPPGTQRARHPRHRREGDVCCDRRDSGDDGVHHVLSAAHPGQRPRGWRGLGRAGCFPVAAPLSQLLDPEPGPRSGGQAPEAHLRVPSEILSLRCLFSLQISSSAPTSRAPCRSPRLRT